MESPSLFQLSSVICIECISVILSFIALLYDIKCAIYARFCSIFASFLSLYLFYTNELYGSCLLTMLMISMHVYGIYTCKTTNLDKKHVIKSLSRQFLCSIVVSGIVVAYLFSWFLAHYIGQKKISTLDGLNLIFSLIATWLLVDKKLENWVIWFSVSIICFFMHYRLRMYGFALLQVVYGILNLWGHYTWRKAYYKKSHEP